MDKRSDPSGGNPQFLMVGTGWGEVLSNGEKKGQSKPATCFGSPRGGGMDFPKKKRRHSFMVPGSVLGSYRENSNDNSADGDERHWEASRRGRSIVGLEEHGIARKGEDYSKERGQRQG